MQDDTQELEQIKEVLKSLASARPASPPTVFIPVSSCKGYPAPRTSYWRFTKGRCQGVISTRCHRVNFIRKCVVCNTEWTCYATRGCPSCAGQCIKSDCPSKENILFPVRKDREFTRKVVRREVKIAPHPVKEKEKDIQQTQNKVDTQIPNYSIAKEEAEWWAKRQEEEKTKKQTNADVVTNE